MSQQIEDKVVSMKFDNAGFEEKIQSTLQTLEQFEKKLKMEASTEGMDRLSDAARNVDLSGVANGVESLNSKFSGLGVMAATVLTDITRKAEAMGSKVMDAITIAPVRDGFNEYETQMNAVQTILANTESKGSTIDDVNRSLKELNDYADLTIYNFTEMTRNIGTFTAAGVELDTATASIKGIANLAAVSGSNSQQASTAMYQLSQALAAGSLKLQDWNSVVNAGMGGQVFQDSLKRTARAHGIAVDDMIKKNGSFRESLQEGWISQDILTETLDQISGKYESYQTMLDKGMSKTEAMKKYNENIAELMKQGYTQKDAEDIIKLGETATNAATKVKTFSQLIDTLKEALGSGWTQTFQYIFGDFEEAKAMWTSVSDYLSNIINNFSNSRNNLLESWHDLGGRKDLLAGFAALAKNLFAILTSLKRGFQDVFPKMTVERLLELTAAFKEYAKSLGFTGKEGKKARQGIRLIGEGIGVVAKIVLSVVGIAVKVGAIVFKIAWNIVKAVLTVIGVFYSIGRAIHKGLEAPLSSIQVLFGLLHGQFSRVTNSAKNAIAGLAGIGSIIGNVFKDNKVLSAIANVASALGMLLYAVLTPLYSFLVYFGISVSAFFNKLKIGDGAIKTLGNAASNVANFLNNIADSINGLRDKVEKSGIGSMFAALGSSIIPALTGVSTTVSSVFEPVINKIIALFDKLKTKVEEFKGNAKTASDSVKAFFKTTKDTIKDEGGDEEKFKIPNPFENLINRIKDFLPKAAEKIEKVYKFVKSKLSKVNWSEMIPNIFIAGSGIVQFTTMRKILKAFEGFSGIPEAIGNVPDVVENLSGALEGLQNKLNGDALKSVGLAMLMLAGAMAILAMIPQDKIMQSIICIGLLTKIMTSFMKSMKDMSKDKGKSFSLIGKQFNFNGDGLGSMVKAMILMAGAILILSIAVSKIAKLRMDKMLLAIVGVQFLLEALLDVVKELGDLDTAGYIDPEGIQMMADAMVVISAAVVVMSVGVAILGSLPLSTLIQGLVAMGVILFAMYEVVKVIGQSPDASYGKAALSIMAMALAVTLLAIPVIALGLLPTGAIIQGGLAVAALIFVMGLVTRLAKSNKGGTGKIIAMGIAIAMLTVPIIALAALPAKKMMLAAAAIATLMIAMGAATMVAGLTKGGGTALMGMSVAILSMTMALAKLASIPVLSLSVALVALGAGLAIIVAAGLIANSAVLGLAALAAVLSAIGTSVFLVGLGINLLAIGLAGLGAAGAVAAGGLTALVIALAVGLASALGILAVGLAEAIVLFVETIGASLPMIMLQIKAFLIMLIKVLRDCAPPLIIVICEVITLLLDAIDAHAEEWTNKLVDIVVKIITVLLERLGEYGGLFLDWAGGVITSIIEAIQNSEIYQTFTEIFDNILEFMDGTLIGSMIEAIGSVISNIVDVFTGDKTISEAFDDIWQGILDAFGDTWVAKFFTAGKNLVQGVINGIKELWDSAVETTETLGGEMVTAYNGPGGIDAGSPSKKTRKSGKWFVQGLMGGVKQLSDKATKMAEQLGSKAAIGLSESLKSDLDTDADLNPTVAPVVDLSNLAKSNKIIEGFFANMATPELAGIGNISSGDIFGTVDFNSDNSDVVSEVQKLRSELSTVKRAIDKRPSGTTTYQFGNIGYDNDAAVESAVKQLVSALSAKRRM